MNTGAFGENFPYSNFHDLNMDWIIKIAKDFLNQYTHLQETISQGEADITDLTEESLQHLDDTYNTLNTLLNEWYETHSADIANQLAQAILNFNNSADAKAAQTIASIPDDYTALYNQVNDDAILVLDSYNSYASLPEAYRNANNLPVNRVIGFKFGWTTEQQATMLNFPVVPFNGEILTINSTKSGQSFGFQLAINEANPASGINNKLYFRSRYSDWTSWVEIQSPSQILNTISANAILYKPAYTSYDNLPSSYRNANNLPTNAVIGYKFGWTEEQQATMSNFPIVPFQGEILTINTTSGAQSFGFQLAITEAAPSSGIANRLYFRSRYADWTSWVEVTNSSNILAQLAGNAIIVHDAYTNYSLLPTAYRDANALPINTILGYKFGVTEEQQATMANFPVVPFQGEIITLNTTKSNAAFGFQIAINEANPSSGQHNRVFFRARYSYWNSWVELPNPVYQNGAYRGLGDFVACGDSLTVSYSYTDETHYVQVKSWAEHLASMMGSECTVKAQGGITTEGFLSSSLMTEAVADTSDFAMLYLGTNDANQQVSVDTFKSNYTSIINGLLTNHNVVFCVPLANATSPSTRDTYNTAIKEVCATFAYGVFLLDMTGLQNQFSNFVKQGHLNSLGYAAFASAVSQALNLVIATHPLMVV